MSAIVSTIFETYINQPASIGLATGVFFWAHTALDKQWRCTHDKEAKAFREDVKKKTAIIEKVEKYLMKFEDDQSAEKQKKINHIIDVAKNSTAIIIQRGINYFLDPENLKKSEQDNYKDLLNIAQEQMDETWARLTAEGLHWEVKLMRETSQLLMPTYAEEAKFICHIYNTDGLNGSKTETIKRLMTSFEQLIVNSWDKYFRKIAYA